MDKKTKTKKKTETKEVDIHCACAMGDLSEFAPIQHENKTETKKTEKILKSDDSKKDNSNKK